LNNEGVRTPQIIPTKAADLITRVSLAESSSLYQCDLQSWVVGRPLGQIEEQAFGDQLFIDRVYEVVGRMAAQVHLHSEAWRLPADFRRSSWDEEGCLGREAIWGYYASLDTLTLDQRRILGDACNVARQRLADFGKSAGRYGLIHGDLIPENVLLDGERCTLIDFDDAGFGWYVAEIAVAVFFQAGTSSFGPALRAMIRGYRQVRELPDSEVAMLDVMLFLRGIAVMGWVRTRAETHTAKTLRPLVTHTSLMLAERLLSRQADPIEMFDFGAPPGLSEATRHI
jgi:Ser/Thr protein kinase RdoA (MazF antagonist)